MKWIFGLVIMLFLSAAYAQTLQNSGGSSGAFTSGSVILAADGASNAPGLSFAPDPTYGLYAVHNNNILGMSFGGSNDIIFTSNDVRIRSATGRYMAGSSDDVALARAAPGVYEVDGGSAGQLREFSARSYIYGGTAPVTLGSCSFGGFVGGNTAGTFTAQGCGGGATNATAMILSFGFAATNGWACDTVDRTAVAVTALVQIASTVSTANFKANTSTGDVVQFKCAAF